MATYTHAHAYWNGFSATAYPPVPAVQEQRSMTVTNLLLHQAHSQIRELEKKLADMSKLAHEDQLTGILNRRGFDANIAREIARAKRQGTPLCVALLDIDDFKSVNDVFGHAAGDKALAHFAQVILGALRKTDCFARMGGEEFVIVLPDTGAENAVETLARTQRKLAAAPLCIDRTMLPLKFSAGLSIFCDADDTEALLHRADTGVYRAKKRGKNCIAVM